MKLQNALKIIIPFLVVIATVVPIIYFSSNDINKGKTQVELWYTYEGTAIIKERVLAYEKQNPDIDIVFNEQPSSGWIDKFISVAQTGDSPDVFLAKGSWLGELANLGYILPLTNYLSPQNESKFHINSIKGLSYENELWALPLWFDSILFFYNPNFFDINGLDYPRDNWTDIELLSYAKEITGVYDDEKVYGLSWTLLSPYMWPAFQSGFGHGNLIQNGQIIVNDSASVEATEFLFDLKYIHDVIAYDDSSSSATQAFINNKSSMLIYGGWYIPILKQMDFNYGLQILPSINSTGKSMSPQVEVKGWGISKDAKNKDICFDIISFLSNEETQLDMLEGEYKVPTLNKLIESDQVQENPDIRIQLEQIDLSQPNPIDPIYNIYSDYMRAALQFIMLELEPIKPSLDEAQAGINSHQEE